MAVPVPLRRRAEALPDATSAVLTLVDATLATALLRKDASSVVDRLGPLVALAVAVPHSAVAVAVVGGGRVVPGVAGGGAVEAVAVPRLVAVAVVAVPHSVVAAVVDSELAEEAVVDREVAAAAVVAAEDVEFEGPNKSPGKKV